ncbi:MAG TPA: 1-deoxy-D-xylulose-5-phosphate reductoisomerase [Xanthomonadaceae bacterium]|nr:1-deoxy-D-xylulose-5-phosphate reductoisomerase [Xanthomonadaceae bacterium]
MKRIAVLGATGSIGASTLDVVARYPDRFRATVLSAHARVPELVELCRRHCPELAVVADPSVYADLRDGLAAAGMSTRAAAGPQALEDAAGGDLCDTVVAAVVGAAGLRSTLAAAAAGKRLLLANKEAVVVAGGLLMAALRQGGGELIPIDSEHNALFQCLPPPALGAAAGPGIRRLVLTASGGPFRGWSRERLAGVDPDQACAHPNWSMGRKISVDSATLMNKGLEVIEAHWLFAAPAARIEVVVHPQSLVHALVEYLDGSMLAQLGLPDMRTALAHALAYPERIGAGVGSLDLAALGRLDFEAPDLAAFPCLALAYRALEAGGTAPAVLNAANEIAVSAFLQQQLAFLNIPAVIETTLASCQAGSGTGDASTLDALLAVDGLARARARAAALRYGMRT